METLIQCHILRCLVLVCIVKMINCQCPIKRTLGLYGSTEPVLEIISYHVSHPCKRVFKCPCWYILPDLRSKFWSGLSLSLCATLCVREARALASAHLQRLPESWLLYTLISTKISSAGSKILFNISNDKAINGVARMLKRLRTSKGDYCIMLLQ